MDQTEITILNKKLEAVIEESGELLTEWLEEIKNSGNYFYFLDIIDFIDELNKLKDFYENEVKELTGRLKEVVTKSQVEQTELLEDALIDFGVIREKIVRKKQGVENEF